MRTQIGGFDLSGLVHDAVIQSPPTSIPGARAVTLRIAGTWEPKPFPCGCALNLEPASFDLCPGHSSEALERSATSHDVAAEAVKIMRRLHDERAVAA